MAAGAQALADEQHVTLQQGDTGNIMGCLLTGDQQPTTTYTAMYFVVADIILMTQYVYYGTLARRKERIYSYMKRKHHHVTIDGDGGTSSRAPPMPNNLRTTGYDSQRMQNDYCLHCCVLCNQPRTQGVAGCGISGRVCTRGTRQGGHPGHAGRNGAPPSNMDAVRLGPHLPLRLLVTLPTA